MSLKKSSLEFYKNIADQLPDLRKVQLKYLLAVAQEAIWAIDSVPHPRYMDLGCGDGVWGTYISFMTHASRTVLVDNCPTMLRLTREISSDYECIQADIENLNGIKGYKNNFKNQFDLITCMWNVLGHMDQPWIALKRIFELLSDGGIAIIDVNNRYNARQYGFINALSNYLEDLFHKRHGQGKIFTCEKNGYKCPVRLFAKWEMDEAIHKHYFEIIEVLYKNYQTGQASSQYTGQLVYVIRKPGVICLKSNSKDVREKYHSDRVCCWLRENTISQ